MLKTQDGMEYYATRLAYGEALIEYAEEEFKQHRIPLAVTKAMCNEIVYFLRFKANLKAPKLKMGLGGDAETLKEMLLLKYDEEAVERFIAEDSDIWQASIVIAGLSDARDTKRKNIHN